MSAAIACSGSGAVRGLAGSTGRRNTGFKSFCWRFKLQGLTGPFVDLTRHLVEMTQCAYSFVDCNWKEAEGEVCE
jgi:hypothetical protein